MLLALQVVVVVSVAVVVQEAVAFLLVGAVEDSGVEGSCLLVGIAAALCVLHLSACVAGLRLVLLTWLLVS